MAVVLVVDVGMRVLLPIVDVLVGVLRGGVEVRAVRVVVVAVQVMVAVRVAQRLVDVPVLVPVHT